MAIPRQLERAFLRWVDYLYARHSQPCPGSERLGRCKLVAHRGAYDNRSVLENTIPAFDRAAAAGIWGLELDVRWTKDLKPVVFHDRSLFRIFGEPLEIGQLAWKEIVSSFPLVPPLAEIVARYGGKQHLMVEIKDGFFPDPVFQMLALKEAVAPLTPGRDYHLMSLNPELFDRIDFVPPETFLPIAELNVSDISDRALRCRYQGISGHFLLLTNRRIARHRQHRQQVGTGFVNSRNCLYRELNRGVEWIFSQAPLSLQAVLNDLPGHSCRKRN